MAFLSLLIFQGFRNETASSAREVVVGGTRVVIGCWKLQLEHHGKTKLLRVVNNGSR